MTIKRIDLQAAAESGVLQTAQIDIVPLLCIENLISGAPSRLNAMIIIATYVRLIHK